MRCARLAALGACLIAACDPVRPVSESETATAPLTAKQPSFSSLTVLPSLGGPARAHDINDAGTIVGLSIDADGSGNAVKWTLQNSSWTVAQLPDGLFGSAIAINAAGDVVGTRGSPQRAILWPVEGGSVVLGCAEDLGPDAALAINSARTAVGYRGPSPGRAVVWMFGACRQDLPPLAEGKYAEARAIDDAGNVAGHAYDAQNNEWAVRWTFQNGAWTIATLDNGQHAAAVGMNSAGDIVGAGCPGTTTPPCQYHAFFWPATGGRTDLGTLGGWQSAAFAINAAQEIVGRSQSRRSRWHAFIWSAANGMRDIGTLRGDERSEASGVSNVAPDGTRKVVGFSQASSGQQRAFVATVK